VQENPAEIRSKFQFLGRKTWWQAARAEREPIGSDKIAGDLAGGGTHRAVRGGVPHGSGPAACPCGGSGF